MYKNTRTVGNQARVLYGVAIVTGAVFPPLWLITIPAAASWHRKQIAAQRTFVAQTSYAAATKKARADERALVAAVRSLPR